MLPATELLQRLNRMVDIFATIINTPGAYDKLDADKKSQIATGINKAYGQAEAFMLEYITLVKAQGKGREIITQVHADVTVGTADKLFAKSVECKSVTTAAKGDVTTQLRKALLQLAGGTGHTPRDGDVRVVDLTITSRDNPWPCPSGSYTTGRAVVLFANLCTQAENEIKSLINENRDGSNSLRTWLAGEDPAKTASVQRLGNVPLQNPVNPAGPPIHHRGSTRPVAVTHSGQVHKIRCVTIKIRYEPGYIVQQSLQKVTELIELTFQSYVDPAHANSPIKKIRTELVKAKVIEVDTFSGSSNTVVSHIR